MFHVSPGANLLVRRSGKNKPNTTKARIHQPKEIHRNTKLTQKTKARFSHLLRQSGLETERVYSGRNSVGIKNRMMVHYAPELRSWRCFSRIFGIL